MHVVAGDLKSLESGEPLDQGSILHFWVCFNLLLQRVDYFLF